MENFTSLGSTVRHLRAGICLNHQPSVTDNLDALVWSLAQALSHIKMDRRMTAGTTGNIYLFVNNLALVQIGVSSGDSVDESLS